MDTTTLITYLASTANSLGLCRPWQERFKRTQGLANLASMYLEGIDFCVKASYPNLDVLRKATKKLSKYGIYIDEHKLQLTNPSNIILNGTTQAHLTYETYSASSLYLRHTSKAYLQAQDNAIVFISLYEDAQLEVKAYPSSHITIFKHQNASVKIMQQATTSTITIKECKTI